MKKHIKSSARKSSTTLAPAALKAVSGGFMAEMYQGDRGMEVIIGGWAEGEFSAKERREGYTVP